MIRFAKHFIICLFLVSCGFQSIYVSDKSDFSFYKSNTLGDIKISKDIVRNLNSLKKDKDILKNRFREKLSYNNLKSKFELKQHENNLKSNLVKEISQDILIYLNSI